MAGTPDSPDRSGIEAAQALGLLKQLFGWGSRLTGTFGLPGVSQGLGALGGPLTLGQGLATGNPLSALMGAAQTGSTVSGLLGGPTITSLLEPVTSAITSALAPVTGALGFGGGGAAAGGAAGAIGAETAGSMAPTLASAAGPVGAALAMSVLPAIIDTGGNDLFDSLLGGWTHEKSRAAEYKDAATAFGPNWQARMGGANLLGNLGQITSPEATRDALQRAYAGIRASDVLPQSITLLNNGQNSIGVKGMNLSPVISASPALEAANEAAWLRLMDQASGQGQDLSPLLAWTEPRSYHGEHHDTTMPGGVYGSSNPFWDLNTASLGHVPVTMSVEQNGSTASRESLDLNRAIGSIGRELGISDALLPGSASPLATAPYQGSGGYLSADQLKDYGMTPGHYVQAIQDFLKGLQPGIENTPGWQHYWG